MNRILHIFLFIGVLSLSGVAQTIKFATVAPDGSTYMKIMREFDAEIRRLTGGEVKFKIYANQSQGDEKAVVRKIRIGQLHAAGFTGVGLGEILPEVRVLELPFLFRNYEEVDYVASLLYDEFSRKFEERGFIILGWADVGFAYVFAQKPIRTLEELRRTKMWMWEGDPLAETTFKALGVSAIPLSLVDVLTSLQTGLIEAVYIPPLPCISLQWHTRVKTMMDVPLANVTGAVLVSRRMFRKLSPEHQQILLEQGKKYMARLVQQAREDNEKSIELMRQNGIQIVSLSEEDLVPFYQAAQQAHQALVGKLYSQELLDRVKQALAEFRSRQEHTTQ